MCLLSKLREARLKDSQGREDLMREISIMKKLQHPHIVRLLELIRDPRNDRICLGMYALRVSVGVQWERQVVHCHPPPQPPFNHHPCSCLWNENWLLLWGGRAEDCRVTSCTLSQ